MAAEKLRRPVWENDEGNNSCLIAQRRLNVSQDVVVFLNGPCPLTL